MKSSISSSSRYQETSSTQSSWIVFVVGVLIATFVGGAIRAFLSPVQLAIWVEQRLAQENPKFILSFEKIEFALSDGYMPAFGFRLNDLKVSAKNPCDTRSTMHVDQIYIPVSFMSSLVGKVRFTDIDISNVTFHQAPPLCNADETERLKEVMEVGPPPSPRVEPVLEKKPQFWHHSIKSFFENRFLIELGRTRDWMDSLQVHSLVVSKPESLEELLSFNSIFVDLNEHKEKLEISGLFKYIGNPYFKSLIDPIEFNVLVTPSTVEMKTVGRFKEGELRSLLMTDVETETYQFKSQINYLPVGEIIRSIQEVKLLRNNIKPRLLWLSCYLSAEGQFGNKEAFTLKAKDCGLSGEAGRIQSENMVITPFAEKKLEPFKLKVDRFSLRYFIDLMGNKGITGVLSKFGEVSGEVEFFSHRDFKLVGQVRDLELMFSNRGKRRIQKIQAIHGEVEYKDSRISGLIDQVDMSGGEFRGILSFNLDKEFQEGILQIKMDALKFGEQVNQIMFFGQPAPLIVYGQSKVESGKIVAWRGNIGLSEVIGSDWSVKGIKAESEFDESVFRAKISVEDFNFESGNEAYNFLAPSYLETEQLGRVQLKDVVVDVEVDEKGGRWDRFRATDPQRDYLFSSKGQWHRLGNVQGWLSVDFPQKKLLGWDISGQLVNPQLIPTVDLLKAVAGENSTIDFKAEMEVSKRVETLKRILDSKSYSPIKELREKVMDTAKKWLPIGQPEEPKKSTSKRDEKNAE